MCGLVVVKRKDKKPAYKSVLKRYRSQKSRGQQGFGYVAVKDGQVVSYKRAPTEHEIVNLLSKEDAEEIWFHHRMPTSVPNIEEAAHPLLVEHEMLTHQYFVAHNGVIRNTNELRRKHEELGILYTTEIMKGFTTLNNNKFYQTTADWNDSESIAVETALMLDGKKKSIDTEGAAAVIGLQTRGKKVINRFFYRNNANPLFYHEDNVMITLTSTSIHGGNEVPAMNIYKLKLDNGFEMVGPPFSAPGSYSPTATFAGRTPSMLPAGRTTTEHRMGFHNWGAASLDDRNDDDFYDNFMPSIPYGDDIIARPLKEVIADVDNIIKRRQRNGGTLIVTSLTRDQLWEEYEKALGAQADLRKDIQKIDNWADSGIVTDKLMEDKLMLQTKLNDVDSYVSDLESEITVRESNSAGARERLTQEEVQEHLSK